MVNHRDTKGFTENIIKSGGNTMKKRTLSIVLACAMAAASLAGCSGGAKDTTAAPTEGTAAETAKTSEAAGGQTTL